MVDINFKTKLLTIDPKIDLKNYIEMDLINMINYPTILTSINIGNQLFQNIQLIIDTGCQYDIALVADDSSMIRSFEVERRKYKSLNKSSIDVTFSDVQLLDKQLKSFTTISPIFCSVNGKGDHLTGLLGLPYLKKYNRIVINYPIKKIYFSNSDTF